MAADVSNKKISTSKLICWIATFAVPVIFAIIPTGEVMTRDIKVFLAITIIALIAFCCQHIPMPVAAITLPMFYVIFGLCDAGTAFSSWSNHLPWLILGGLVFAAVLVNVGLAKRIAYKCILLTGCNYTGIIWGVAISSLIIAMVIPGNGAFPMLALTYGICRALDFGKSKASAGIMMTAIITTTSTWTFAYYPNSDVMLAAGEGVTGPMNIAWLDWLKFGWPMIIAWLIIIFLITKLFKPDQPMGDKEYFHNEYKAMGAFSTQEKKAAVITVILFASICTSSLHKIPIGFCFAIFAMLFFIPGIGVGEDELKNVNFSFVIFIASCMTIGNVAASLGIGQIAANLVTPILQGRGVVFVLIFAWLFAVLINFLMTPMAIIAGFTVPFAQIALNLGLNPMPIYLTMIYGMSQLVLPYEFADYLLYYSFDMIPLKDFTKIMGIKMALSLVFLVAIMIPYWKLIGLL